MSDGLPVVSGGGAVAALQRAGFTETGRRGSHLKLRNDVGRIVIVPLHRELARGTLRSILRQAGFTVEEFVALLQ